jgi:hypothetical protein
MESVEAKNFIETTANFTVSYKDLKQNSLDLLLSLEERLKFLSEFYDKNPEEIHEVINIVTNMYFFSNTSVTKNYMKSICGLKKLPIICRLECAKNIENECYNFFYIMFSEEEKEIDELSTPLRIDSTIFFMNSEDVEHQKKSLEYFCKIIKDYKIDDLTRFKTIQNLEGKIHDVSLFFNYTKVSTLIYILDNNNKDELRVIACQYFFEKLKTNEMKVVEYLTSIAENIEINEDIRADSCDILLRYAFSVKEDFTDEQKREILSCKENIETILFKLGGGNSTRNNIFKNKQNVHVKSINESVNKNLEKILSFKFGICCDRISEEPFEKIQKELLIISNENKYDTETLASALTRICIDRATYSSKNMTLKSILIKIWNYIQNSPNVNKYSKEVEKRLIEEIIESKGKCSSGFTARLLNSLSGFDEEINISISFKDQIIANLEARLNSKLQNLKDEEYRNKILSLEYPKDLETLELKDEEYRDKVLEEMTIDTSQFNNRKNFLKFFREHISHIREDMYQEFKSFMPDEEYDAYFKEAILHYEGS